MRLQFQKNRPAIFPLLPLLLPLLLLMPAAWAETESGNVHRPAMIPLKYGIGKRKFDEFCSRCHGDWGEGSDQGPPLIHPFYKPSHHANITFYRAARNGVKAHHWKFGDMPPVEGVTEKDVAKIIDFIRWLQRENGIY